MHSWYVITSLYSLINRVHYHLICALSNFSSMTFVCFLHPWLKQHQDWCTCFCHKLLYYVLIRVKRNREFCSQCPSSRQKIERINRGHCQLRHSIWDLKAFLQLVLHLSMTLLHLCNWKEIECVRNWSSSSCNNVTSHCHVFLERKVDIISERMIDRQENMGYFAFCLISVFIKRNST